MARIPSKTDFQIDVESVGQFTFARRRMRDEIMCQVEYARMIDGVQPTAWLNSVCGALADLKVLTVKAPDGWDLDELEPHENETFAKLMRVQGALLQKEASFRAGAAPAVEATRPGEVGDNRVPVSAQVQPAGD